MNMRIGMMLVSGLFGSVATAAGIDCASLPDWSNPIDGYRVNLHHVYCGEAGNNGSAKGFHAMPNGEAPSDYVASEPGDKPNAAGIYTLKRIKLKLGGSEYTKSFSSMFPKHCSPEQINQSIVYSLANSSGSCTDPSWASCGPNAPDGSSDKKYCLGSNGTKFTIASATLRGEAKKINTGFPIYTK